MQDYQRAHDAAVAALWAEEDAEGHHELAVAQEGLGLFAEALASYDRALKADGRFAAALMGKAALLATCPEAGLRNAAEARRAATRACELVRPGEGRSAFTLALVLGSEGKYADAIKASKEARELNPSHRRVRAEVDAAIEAFEEARPFRPRMLVGTRDGPGPSRPD
jgi:tetratricopeptide (TPR) repeat protein